MIVRGASLPITPWKNGAGRKTDIAAGPGWTIGYAWLDGDAPFSDYAGHDRTITLLEGAGFTLEMADGEIAVRVAAQDRPTGFDGGASLLCRVTDGPCRVLNVMTARATLSHGVEILAGDRVHVPAASGTRLLVSWGTDLAVTTEGGTQMLAPFDAISLPGAASLSPAPGRRAALLWVGPTAR